MTQWMLRCKEVSQKVSQSMDTRLPLHQRMAIRMHLWMCRYCALFARQLRMLREMGRRVDGEDPHDTDASGLSSEAKERMKKKLRDVFRS